MYDGFQHKDIVQIFPWLKGRTLISWSERGLIKPDITDASGRGSTRTYSFANLVEIGILDELLRHGIPFSLAKMLMDSDPMRTIFARKKYNVIFVFERLTVSSNVPMDKEPPWVGESHVMSVEEFLKAGNRLLSSMSSMIAINIGNIAMFIEKRVKSLR